MSGVQMMGGRQNLLREYPMNARFMMSICSYASRRAGSNLLALMGAPAVIRNAHGNWKTDTTKATGSGMADVYTGGSGCGDDNNGGGDINGGDGSSHQQFHNTSWVKVLCRVHTVPLS